MGPAAVIQGLDLGLRHERDADEFIVRVVRALQPAGSTSTDAVIVASTHLVQGPQRRHVAVAFGTEDPDLQERLAERLRIEATAGELEQYPSGAQEAVAEHAAQRSGRVVCFAGARTLTGVVPIGQVLSGTAIDRVTVIGDDDPGAETVLVTRNFVRPRWVAGELVLHTQPNIGGTLVPFESPNPTPCCQDHL